MRLWNRLNRLFGFGRDDAAAASEPATAEPAPDEPEPAPGTCTICGTDVDPGADACPLCGSTDIAFDGDDGTGEESADPAPKTTRSASDDDAVAKLKALRERDEE